MSVAFKKFSVEMAWNQHVGISWPPTAVYFPNCKVEFIYCNNAKENRKYRRYIWQLTTAFSGFQAVYNLFPTYHVWKNYVIPYRSDVLIPGIHIQTVEIHTMDM